MPTYFEYCRKSSEAEDRQILSIDSQINELERFAAQKGLTVSAVLTETKSAKAPSRPVFNSLMERLYQGETDGNAIKHVNQEIKRRTRMVSLFPNELSLLPLVTALSLKHAEFTEKNLRRDFEDRTRQNQHNLPFSKTWQQYPHIIRTQPGVNLNAFLPVRIRG
jgi:hypothetical protein